MSSESGFGVGLAVADPGLPAELPPPPGRPVRLAEVLPVAERSPEEKALELRRVQVLESMLAAYELELVAGLAADRPDSVDRRPEQPGAAAPEDPAGPVRPPGVSEFFADELAMVLRCSRTAATVLTEQATTLTTALAATLAALADGRFGLVAGARAGPGAGVEGPRHRSCGDLRGLGPQCCPRPLSCRSSSWRRQCSGSWPPATQRRPIAAARRLRSWRT
ncbi:hypothetical protein [Geodermatophilus sp. CPCC 205761]|uniref:hypothetical protein n=1 Tax=Geodermatophilus sp. CPCC 205761 TaxID=2936597 RepID=UPI003EEDAA97